MVSVASDSRIPGVIEFRPIGGSRVFVVKARDPGGFPLLVDWNEASGFVTSEAVQYSYEVGAARPQSALYFLIPFVLTQMVGLPAAIVARWTSISTALKR